GAVPFRLGEVPVFGTVPVPLCAGAVCGFAMLCCVCGVTLWSGTVSLGSLAARTGCTLGKLRGAVRGRVGMPAEATSVVRGWAATCCIARELVNAWFRVTTSSLTTWTFFCWASLAAGISNVLLYTLVTFCCWTFCWTMFCWTMFCCTMFCWTIFCWTMFC